MCLRKHHSSFVLIYFSLNNSYPSKGDLTSTGTVLLSSGADKDSHNSQCELRKREFYYVMRLFQLMDMQAKSKLVKSEEGGITKSIGNLFPNKPIYIEESLYGEKVD